MKRISLIIVPVVLFASQANASCDQRLYDAIYKKITQEAIAKGLRAMTDEEDHKVLLQRAEIIESLRLLCKGQRSSYETGKAVVK